jgi:Ca2+-transporting ATPase
VGTLLTYQYAVAKNYDEQLIRTMVFAVLIIANIFLTLVNRSFYYSIFTTMRYKNNLVVLIIGFTVGITAMLFYVKPFALFFGFVQLDIYQIGLCTAVGFLSVSWYELIKWGKRKKVIFKS